MNCAAIANSKASKIYDLKIVDREIQDLKNNETRCVVLSNDHEYTGFDKTSIIFSVDMIVLVNYMRF